MAAEGELVAILPGTYAAPGDTRLATRLIAVGRHFPDSVITGSTAAAVTFWPELETALIEVARTMSTRPVHGPFRFSHRDIPAQLIRRVDGFRATTPALTALDLIPTHGTDAIDRVLRSRATTVVALHAALTATPNRAGNADRMRVLLDSRAGPWSGAERLAHRLLRQAGITGWVANHEIRIRVDELVQTYFLDIAFLATRTALEIEGNRWHSTPKQLNRDRYRHNDVTIAGWHTLRIDVSMLTRDPGYFVELARAAASH